MPEIYKNFLHAVGEMLTDLATDFLKNSEDLDHFDKGRRMAFYEVISLFVEQAQLWGISKDDIGMSSIQRAEDILLPPTGKDGIDG